MRAFPILLLAVALSIPVAAPAAALKPWVRLDGSLGKYSMGDMNRELAGLNTGLAGTALRFWPIASGPGCGGSAGVDFGPGFSFGVGYDRVFASSGVEGAAAYGKVRLPANELRGLLEYAFPRRGPLGGHVGVAAGKLMVTGQIVSDSAFDVRGTAPLFEAYVGGDWWGQPRCGLFATVGYRYARVNEVKIDGQVEHNPDSTKFRLDYSGLLLRFGVKVPLGASANAPAPAAGGGLKPWLNLGGSWGSYAMTDVPFDIGTDEAGAATQVVSRKVSSGPGLGASAGLDFPGRFAVGVGFDRLYASGKADYPGGSIDYRLPANALRGFVEFRLPARGHFGTRLGVAGGTVMAARSAALPDTNSTGTVSRFPVKGSGPLVEAYGSGEWWASPRFAATASLGYRYAKAGEIKLAQVVRFKGGSPLTVDYSGIIARIGLKVALTR